MSLPRSGFSLLLGLTTLAAAGAVQAEPPVPGEPVTPGEASGETPTPRPPGTLGETPRPDRAPRPKKAMALHDEAWALYEEGRYRAAIDRLEAALRLDPDARELVYNLAVLHEK